jgi:hypothetical protein
LPALCSFRAYGTVSPANEVVIAMMTPRASIACAVLLILDSSHSYIAPL